MRRADGQPELIDVFEGWNVDPYDLNTVKGPLPKINPAEEVIETLPSPDEETTLSIEVIPAEPADVPDIQAYYPPQVPAPVKPAEPALPRRRPRRIQTPEDIRIRQEINALRSGVGIAVVTILAASLLLLGPKKNRSGVKNAMHELNNKIEALFED